MKKLIYILFGASLFVGCSSEDDSRSEERVPLRIAAGIEMTAEGETRAVETAWEYNDKIGVFITDRISTTIYTDASSGSPVEAKNLEYTFDDGSNYETYGNTFRLFTPTTKIYLPSTPVAVYGYYPYSAKKLDEITDVDPEAVEIDVSSQTSQKAIDFMRAKNGNVSNSNTSVELLFQHRLVKLVFNLKQGEGLLEDELKDATVLTMSVGSQFTKAIYNVYSDAFIIAGGATLTDITPVRASSAPTGFVRTFEAIVLPNFGSNSAIDRKVTITFYRKAEDTIVNTFTIPYTTYFNPGYKYTYNITVNATSIRVDPLKYTEQW